MKSEFHHNIEIFADTQYRIRMNRELRRNTARSFEETRIIPAGFSSGKTPYYAEAKISFEQNPTLVPARKAAKEGRRTAVLNFANPVEPGGGVQRGAKAQEEYLCRATNLYECLAGPCASDYYEGHKEMMRSQTGRSFPGTDRIIFSPGIAVIREDRRGAQGDPGSWEQVYTDDWVFIDVLTCAAPYFSDPAEAERFQGLDRLLASRIRNILETAIEAGAETLILGAFGCGAFHNPPGLVARIFGEAFSQRRYRHAFREVIFAVLGREGESENTNVFRCWRK